MEQWQIEALEKLLSKDRQGAGTSVEVSERRIYLHSSFYGDTRYHVVSHAADGDVIIDQTDHDQKYQQRIILEEQEIEPLLRWLLAAHLAKVRKQNEQASTEESEEDDALGDLDEHPF